MEAVEASVEQLVRMPNMGAPRELRNPALKGLRLWPVKDFDEFLIFYVVIGDKVRVVRILHGKRDVDRILRKESGDDDKVHWNHLHPARRPPVSAGVVHADGEPETAGE